MPLELVSEAEYLGMAMNQYAEYKGLNPHRFYSMFGGTHAQMRSYCRLSDVSGLSLDEIAEMMLMKQTPRLIQMAMQASGSANLHQLAVKCGVSDTWLNRLLIENNGELRGLHTYYEAATALGWTLEKMRKACKM